MRAVLRSFHSLHLLHYYSLNSTLFYVKLLQKVWGFESWGTLVRGQIVRTWGDPILLVRWLLLEALSDVTTVMTDSSGLAHEFKVAVIALKTGRQNTRYLDYNGV